MIKDEDDMAVTLTIGELRALIREVVNEELTRMPSVSPAEIKSDDEETLTIKQLSEFLGCSTVTIHNHRKKGWLPKPYQVGKKVVWKKSDVMNWMNSPMNQRRTNRKKYD
jgi:predicted DNA-binding transcriptional regulator AlpA